MKVLQSGESVLSATLDPSLAVGMIIRHS